MKVTDLHWFAGLMEGEGTFFIQKDWSKGKLYEYPLLAILMSDRDVIERVAALVYATVFSYQPKPPSKKRLYRATVVGGRAVWWMKKLLPLMGKRRQDKIKGILSEWESRVPTEIRRRKSCQKFAATRSRNTAGQFVKINKGEWYG